MCYWQLSCSLSGEIGEDGWCDYFMTEDCEAAGGERQYIEDQRTAFRHDYWQYIEANE